MSVNAGIWIDHHRAVLVGVTGGEEEITEIESDVEKPFSLPAGSGSGSEHPQHYLSEIKQEHKFMNQLNGYYDEVLKALHGVERLLIFGPGEAKGEFRKRLESQHFPVKTLEIATADKMTDPQIAAKVRKHFEDLQTHG